ncbi:DNA-directed RNA polymerase delta subunit, putative [Heliomicrobium modesticaldum Ice1]|uniref:RNAP delta factor n=1 Tax=Heliobacterium modesticaldum (strain ATCC 51547 / Ice1) TaxID=498761 RepID=B0TI88_HELMI|nr:DNA-directed RNA polymerase subunit delta [Heliomicrobium modesticaldum]ABZ83508.1 DNA-directed RNA polymerase delta subunit, putative [Heliomicrobium modesticaldum Ice1]
MSEPITTVNTGRRVSEMDVLFQLLKEKGENTHFRDLIVQALARIGYEDPEDPKSIAAVYTQMNLDMRFVHIGNGFWGLRNWAPAKSARRIPTISLLNKTVEYEDGESGDDEDYDDRDHDYGRIRDDDWERAE